MSLSYLAAYSRNNKPLVIGGATLDKLLSKEEPKYCYRCSRIIEDGEDYEVVYKHPTQGPILYLTHIPSSNIHMGKEYLCSDCMKDGLIKGWIRDTPIISDIYELGRQDGQKEGRKQGCEETSVVYEEILRKQAEEFLSQRKDIEKEKEEFEELLDAYERSIDELERKVNSTEGENETLRKMLSVERKLKNLKKK